MKEELRRELTMEETRMALWGMCSYKASGSDGYQAIFFK